MPDWLDVNWRELFVPSRPILETMLRGTATYLSLFLLLRLFRRQTGSLGPADLLVLLLIADASQNAMAGEYRAITDGLILVCTIITWEYILDALCFYVPAIGKLIDRQPLPVIEHGKLLPDNLRRELMSEDELLSQLRQKGVESFDHVKHSFIEGDGSVSVITKAGQSPIQSHDKDRNAGIT
jgi:uncharacterized membrane protein YcaP (DUF421 family)